MSFSEKTLLLPEVHEPYPFVFFKVINFDENPFAYDMPIKSISLTHKGTYSPIVAKVASIDIFNNELIFLVKSDDKEHIYSVSTDDHYIMEEDEIDSVLQIEFENIKVENTNDDMENKLIETMKRDPSIAKKIPQELKDHPSFKRKLDVERTKGRLKGLDTIGDSTNSIYFPSVLPDDTFQHINAYLGTNTDKAELNEAIHRKTRRIAPKPTIRPPCKGNCSISGGTRKRNSTRKNKKRYGRL